MTRAAGSANELRSGFRARVIGALAALALVFVAALSPVAALDFPARTGRVVDEVGIIDAATAAKLNARLFALEAKTGDQVMVVVVKSLRELPIDTYNYALGQYWDVGGSDGKGAVLMLAPREGKIGVHARWALGNQLTKPVLDRIFDQSIVPAFARNDVPGGLLQAVDDITEVLTGERPQEALPSVAGRAPQNAISIATVAAAFAADDKPQAAEPAAPPISSALSAHALSAPADSADDSLSPRPSFPALTGRVVDEASILGERRDLAQELAALEAKTTDQLVVATVASLHGQSIEQYANGLFRHWRIGQKDKNNGVLLLVAPNERKVRIEVGYGLEGVLTDALSKAVIEQSILPRFRSNDMAGGVSAGVDEIVRILTADPAEAKRRAEAAGQSSFAETVGSLLGTALIVLIVIAAGGFVAYAAGMLMSAVLLNVGVALGLLPKRKHRGERWKWLDRWDFNDGKSSHSSSSSSSSDSFSGGGGSSGGGGASGGW